MKSHKVVVLIIISAIYFLSGVDNKAGESDSQSIDLQSILLATFASVMVNIIDHDQNVLYPLVIFGILFIIFASMSIYCGLISVKKLMISWLVNFVCAWLLLFIRNDVNKRKMYTIRRKQSLLKKLISLLDEFWIRVWRGCCSIGKKVSDTIKKLFSAVKNSHRGRGK